MPGLAPAGGGVGVCARQRTYFLLLRQKKVSNEKATLLPATPAAPGQPAVLGPGGVWLELALRAQTIASPDPPPSALLGAGRRVGRYAPSLRSVVSGRVVTVCYIGWLALPVTLNLRG